MTQLATRMQQKRPDVARIAAASLRFRNAIEKCDRTRLPITFERFPRGSCGDTTPLLGAFLKDQGLGAFDYVLGTRGNQGRIRSHAWLQAGGLIVDITADQFPEITETVIVTFNSEWHSSFEQERPHVADYRIYDEHTVATLHRAYQTISEGLAR